MTISKERKNKLKAMARAAFVRPTEEELAGTNVHPGLWDQCSTPEERTFVELELKFMCKVIGNLP